MSSTSSKFSFQVLSAFLFLSILSFLIGCSLIPADARLKRFEFEEPQMGVPFRIVMYARNEKEAVEAASAAFQRIAQLNTIMSDYETDSEVSTLSRSSEEGSPAVPVSDELWRVLSTAQQLAEQTGGAFDITVGPCAALWRKARREQQFPDAARLENARKKVGFKNLVLDEQTRTARLLRFGMRLDLGGIAKGFAADEALQQLRARGITRALVAASGDVAVSDPPPGQTGWRIEVVGYDQPGGPPSAFVLLNNSAISTSGDLFQRLELNGVRYSHILDPSTCVGMTNRALATVIAGNCTLSDSLATIMTILPATEALALAAEYKAAARIARLEDNEPVVIQNEAFIKFATIDTNR
jgi:FAD:protein FMN transferase